MLRDRPPAILIVEDEAIVATDLQETLAEMGYDPYAIAASADEALTRAAERCPDLVLMDIRIHGERDGIETAALLRNRFEVPIVYLTAHADEATLRRARETEPYGYLTKPIKAADLRSAVELTLHKHEMEQRLRQRERWFSTTLRSISDAVITVDMAGAVTFMNAAAEVLLGVTAAAAIGRPARELVHLLDPAQPASPLDVVLEHKAAVHIAEAPLARVGGNRIIADRTSPVLDDGEMLGAVMVFRDVTEQKVLQKQVELSERLVSLGTMAAGVAHEVNNPLAVVLANAAYVRGELEALRDRGGGDPTGIAAALEAQRDLESAATRITSIVADLKAFARPSTRTAGTADIAEAVRWTIRSTALELRHRARVIVELADGLHVKLDETRLGQVLVNLVMNAAHAIAPGAFDQNAVTIHARRDGDEAVIEIRDTGTGMTADVARRIFEPFYSTKDVGTGTGLGLSICHGIVTSAGGRLELVTELNVGTTFRVWLPLATPAARAEPAPAIAPGVRRGRILVIDDEPLMLKAMRRILRDHDVVSLSEARAALTLLDGGARFDMIFSDLMMPSMTGMELYERLLADHPEVARTVVFITGGVTNPSIADFLAVVPNLWLEKPVDSEDLRALVQHRLASPP